MSDLLQQVQAFASRAEDFTRAARWITGGETVLVNCEKQNFGQLWISRLCKIRSPMVILITWKQRYQPSFLLSCFVADRRKGHPDALEWAGLLIGCPQRRCMKCNAMACATNEGPARKRPHDALCGAGYWSFSPFRPIITIAKCSLSWVLEFYDESLHLPETAPPRHRSGIVHPTSAENASSKCNTNPTCLHSCVSLLELSCCNARNRNPWCRPRWC